MLAGFVGVVSVPEQESEQVNSEHATARLNAAKADAALAQAEVDRLGALENFKGIVELAVVDAHGKVALKRMISIGRNLGAKVGCRFLRY